VARKPKYVITADRHQWIVNRVRFRGEKSAEPGSEYLDPIGYCASLRDAQRFAADTLARELWPAEGVPLEEVYDHLVAEHTEDRS